MNYEACKHCGNTTEWNCCTDMDGVPGRMNQGWSLSPNCDGWFEDEPTFPTREAAEERLRILGQNLEDDAEIFWNHDSDGFLVLIASAEHWTLVARASDDHCED